MQNKERVLVTAKAVSTSIKEPKEWRTTHNSYRMKKHQKRTVRYRKIIEDFFGGYVCERCHFKGQAVQFDCHHLPGHEKLKSIRDFVRSGTKEELIQELQKCELLCSNCHRLEHSS